MTLISYSGYNHTIATKLGSDYAGMDPEKRVARKPMILTFWTVI